jgi:hypothetical protein
MKGIIRYNLSKSKYELMTKDQKKRLVTSKSKEYLEALVSQQKHRRILQHKITEVEIISTSPEIKITDSAGAVITNHNQFSVEQRFVFTEQLVGMVVKKSAKSVVISGQGGVGKTYLVLETLKKHGKTNVQDTIPSIEDFTPGLEVDDDEEEMEEKVLASINRPTGDFTVIKGYSSAKGLYRSLFENRHRTIVFDDCDEVLKNGTAIGLLKNALDSYEDRWVYWNVETPGESDLPKSFRFQGSIIFISNMPLHKIDEAVRTRCFKVDVSMTPKQRIERMYNVLENVMPDIDMMDKLEALNLMEKNLAIAKEVNFRALMNVISIRVSGIDDWKNLAMFALTEH